MAARRIVTQPHAVVGSIGVISAGPRLPRLLDRLGVTVTENRAGRLKGIGAPWRDETDEERAKEQAIVDAFYDAFVARVVGGPPPAARRASASSRPARSGSATRRSRSDSSTRSVTSNARSSWPPRPPGSRPRARRSDIRRSLFERLAGPLRDEPGERGRRRGRGAAGEPTPDLIRTLIRSPGEMAWVADVVRPDRTGEGASRSETPMDPDREPAPLEEGQCRQDARDRPTCGRDQLIHRRATSDQLAAEAFGSLADTGQRRGDVGRHPRLDHAIGQAEVLDQLRDAGHDPGATRELAQVRQAAGRRRGIDAARHQEAFAPLLERP